MAVELCTDESSKEVWVRRWRIKNDIQVCQVLQGFQLVDRIHKYDFSLHRWIVKSDHWEENVTDVIVVGKAEVSVVGEVVEVPGEAVSGGGDCLFFCVGHAVANAGGYRWSGEVNEVY